MNAAELKNNLHRLIVETNDVNILKQISNYITQLKKEGFPSMSKEQIIKQALKAEKEIKKGNVSSHEDFLKEASGW